MKGSYEGAGSMAQGFSMNLNGGSEDTLSLGAFMPVDINGSISDLTGLRFYTVGYKIFKAQNEDSQSQTVNCVIKLCAAGACTWPVADDCSAEGDDYGYSALVVSA